MSTSALERDLSLDSQVPGSCPANPGFWQVGLFFEVPAHAGNAFRGQVVKKLFVAGVAVVPYPWRSFRL